jgi:ketosteroid isomerase-like protein
MESGSPWRDTAWAMSEENVEVVRRAIAAWNDGDISIYRDLYAADVVAEAGPLGLEGIGAIHGPEAIMAIYEKMRDSFERDELIADHALANDESLVVPVRWRGVARGTTTMVEQRLFIGYRFRDGSITFQGWYDSVEKACEAVGLSPAATHVEFAG